MRIRFSIFGTLVFLIFLGCDSPRRVPASVNASSDHLTPLSVPVSESQSPQDDAYQLYLNFFEEIYDLMEKNYYAQVNRRDFSRFIDQFDKKIYAKLKATGKSVDFIRWRSAAYLVDFLKTKEDVFSAFYPPKPAKEYEQTAMGVRIDLGIEGERTERGFLVTQVEPRSDAYEKGLRPADMILAFNQEMIREMSPEKLQECLNPFQDSQTDIRYICTRTGEEASIAVVSREYFKQTVFPFNTGVPLIYGLRVERFNRKTSEDMLRYLNFFREQGSIKGLILDFRGNPGGPPLAAREIASFFLTQGEDFAYFHKKGFEEATLDVPEIPEQYRYDGPLVILIDQESGSASELFSGVLQKKDRAVLMGSNSAGQVMLKSMFPLQDESMLLLITSRGYYHDGSVFSFGGLVPEKYVNPRNDDELIRDAATYLVYVNKKINHE